MKVKKLNGMLELEGQKNIKTLLEELNNQKDEVVSEIPFNEENISPTIKVDTDLKNSTNEILMTIKRKNSHLAFQVNSLTSGLISADEFFDLIEYIIKNSLEVTSETESWLTLEVKRGLLQIKEKIHSNKIVKGMQKTTKEIGRPSNEEQIQLAIKMYKSGEYTGEQIAQITGVSRSTLYRHLNK